MLNHPSLRLSLLSALFLPACGGNPAVGTYVPDLDAMKKMVLQTAGIEAKDRNAAEQRMDEWASKLKVEITLHADATFNGSFFTFDLRNPRVRTMSGTYEIAGDKLTLTTLVEDAKKMEPPVAKSGTIKDGVITLDHLGLSMTLKKR